MLKVGLIIICFLKHNLFLKVFKDFSAILLSVVVFTVFFLVPTSNQGSGWCFVLV